MRPDVQREELQLLHQDGPLPGLLHRQICEHHHTVMDNLKRQTAAQHIHIAGVRTAAGCGGEAGGGEQGRHVQRLLRHLRHHLLSARPLLLRLQRCGGGMRGQESGDCQYWIDKVLMIHSTTTPIELQTKVI